MRQTQVMQFYVYVYVYPPVFKHSNGKSTIYDFASYNIHFDRGFLQLTIFDDTLSFG